MKDTDWATSFLDTFNGRECFYTSWTEALARLARESRR